MKTLLWLSLLISAWVTVASHEAEDIVILHDSKETTKVCVGVRIAARIELKPNPSDTNEKVRMEIPEYEGKLERCWDLDRNNTERIPWRNVSLNWMESKGMVFNRNITVEVGPWVPQHEGKEHLAVNKITAVFETKKTVLNEISVSDKHIITEYILMKSHKMDPIMFLTDSRYSDMCIASGTRILSSSLHTSTEPRGNDGIQLPDALLSTIKVELMVYTVNNRNGTTSGIQFIANCSPTDIDQYPMSMVCMVIAVVVLIAVGLFVYREFRGQSRMIRSIRDGYESL